MRLFGGRQERPDDRRSTAAGRRRLGEHREQGGEHGRCAISDRDARRPWAYLLVRTPLVGLQPSPTGLVLEWPSPLVGLRPSTTGLVVQIRIGDSKKKKIRTGVQSNSFPPPVVGEEDPAKEEPPPKACRSSRKRRWYGGADGGQRLRGDEHI